MKYLILVILIVFSCTPSIKTESLVVEEETKTRNIFYSKANESYPKTIAQYKDIPVHSGRRLESFLDSLHYIKKKDVPDSIVSRGHIYCQPLIDEVGTVCSIIVLKSLIPYLDSLALESIKKSKFKTLKNKDGLPQIYSLLFDFEFINGIPMYPVINKQDTRKFLKDRKTKNLRKLKQKQRNKSWLKNVLNFAVIPLNGDDSYVEEYIKDYKECIHNYLDSLKTSGYDSSFSCEIPTIIKRSGHLTGFYAVDTLRQCKGFNFRDYIRFVNSNYSPKPFTKAMEIEFLKLRVILNYRTFGF